MWRIAPSVTQWIISSQWGNYRYDIFRDSPQNLRSCLIDLANLSPLQHIQQTNLLLLVVWACSVMRHFWQHWRGENANNMAMRFAISISHIVKLLRIRLDLAITTETSILKVRLNFQLRSGLRTFWVTHNAKRIQATHHELCEPS